MARVIRTQARDPFTGKALGPARVREHVTAVELSDEPHGRPSVDPMPNGDDITVLFDWVGYDPDRAKAAMVAEHDREHIRSEVLENLSSVSTRETP